MKLDVYVEDRIVGVLEQSAGDRFVFTYLRDTEPSDAVSILMPVRTESYPLKTLHPFFQISLPEGVILSALNARLARAKGGRVSEMDLLAAIGHNTIGRVRTVPLNQELPAEFEDRGVEFLLKQSPQFLSQWFLEERLLQSGVSGAFPKGFAADAPRHDERETLRSDTWIIKFDDSRYPCLSFNERWSMEVARRALLNASHTVLSDDMRSLAVERFDRQPGEPFLGFEDFCSLTGRSPAEKYSGSVERIVKVIKMLVKPERCAAELTAFFGTYLCCSTLRNDDAHTKNFGLLYDEDPENAQLAPIYDMVTSSVYVPAGTDGDSSQLALQFTGTRKWLDEKLIVKLGDLCGLSKRQRNIVENNLSDALLSVAQELSELTLSTDFRSVTQRMVALWSHGARVFDATCADQLLEISMRFESASEVREKMSDYE